MRIRLEKGMQKKLISDAKSDKSWTKLAKLLNLNEHYLALELFNEQRTLPDKTYATLCAIAGKNYDSFIVNKIQDNWGRSLGGLNSDGNTKKFIAPSESKKLAELFGAVLGDGHLDKYIVGKRVRRYAVEISGHISEDRDYVSNYLLNIMKRLFNEKPKIKLTPKYGSLFAILYGRNLVEFFEKKGINPGNKKYNNQGIPSWILKNRSYLKCCLRGLIDTDGSIHYISKNNKNLRISFTSYIPQLLQDVRDAFIRLGFNPCKIIREKQFFISRKEEVKRYVKWVGFGNQKHLKRIERLKS